MNNKIKGKAQRLYIFSVALLTNQQTKFDIFNVKSDNNKIISNGRTGYHRNHRVDLLVTKLNLLQHIEVQW